MKLNAPKKSPRSVTGRIKSSYPRLLRILVPLDFSGYSRQALRYAVPLAQKFGARIVLVHVLTGQSKLPVSAQQSAAAAAMKRLETTANQLIPRPYAADKLVMSGHPAEQIIHAVERAKIDMIVLSAKGRSGLKRALLGSTAEHVMRRAVCPVLSVRRT